MAFEKNLKTRIVLTHDEYADLKSKKLKEGEVVLAKVGTTEANGKVSEPIWMMKVGKGNDTTVENCPWLVAPAADVYEWAKKAKLDWNDVDPIPGDKLGLTVTVTGDGNVITDASWDATTKTLTLTRGETFATKGYADGELAKKADKVTGATAGNFAGLDENGNLTDSGKKVADFAEAIHNHKASDLTDFSDEVKAVVNGMGLGTNDTINALDKRLTQAEADIDALETASATHATKTELTDGLALKVDKTTYEAKVEELEGSIGDAQGTADEALDKIDAFMDANAASDETVNTLKEIIALIESEDAELSSTLMAEITSLKNKFNEDGKALKAVDADTVDGKHSTDFATSEQGATADSTAATIATYGDIVTHYVDEFQVAGDYETAGAAAKALEDAKKYTDDEIAELDLANTYAAKEHTHTMKEITDLDVGVTKVSTTANNGLKVTPEAGTGDVVIDIDDTIVFVLDGGDASNLY